MAKLKREDHVLRFVKNLHLTGDFAGQKFAPRPFQETIYRRLFATDEQGRLITRDAMLMLPRKVGKTYLCATICVYALFTFGKEQCILSAAASQDQANRLMEQVRSIIEQDEYLLSQCKITKNRIDHLPSGSHFVSVASGGLTGLGTGPSLILIDEFCAWRTKRHKETYTALTTGSAARNNPLTIKITTQTTNRFSLAGEEFEVARKLKNRIENGKTIADGELDRPNYLAVLYYLPGDADWHDEKLWHEVCPGLGDYLSLKEYRDKHQEACDFPSRAADFQVYFLNMPADDVERWMPMERWKACETKFSAASLEGQVAWAGLDIAPVSDLSSLTLVIPFDDKGKTKLRVLQWSWLNKETLAEKAKTESVSWLDWKRKKLLKETPGNTTCTRTIAEDIIAISQRYRIKTIAADQMHCFEVGQRLQEAGLTVQWFRPYYAYMGPPTDRIEKMALEQSIEHNGDELLRYCISNVRCETDSNGNQRPCNDRRLRHEKIDAAVALIYAVGVWMDSLTQKESVYERRARERAEAEKAKAAAEAANSAA